VDCAVSATVLLAKAAGIMAALRLSAANAARIMFFIGILQSGEMSGVDGLYMDLCSTDDNLTL
jgi:hypothetical protein